MYWWWFLFVLLVLAALLFFVRKTIVPSSLNQKKEKFTYDQQVWPFRKEEKVVFVTVGTTKFNELISQVDSVTFQSVLKEKGFSGLLLQIGEGDQPKNSLPLDEHASHQNSFRCFYYRYKTSLSQDISAASLIISHAGSGSILESLRAGKPLIVTPNSMLMDNHQMDLADDLSSNNFLWSVVPSKLVSFLQTKNLRELETSLTPYPPVDTANIKHFLDGLKTSNRLSQKSFIILGSGGHTAEMINLMKFLDKDYFKPRCYIIAKTDATSKSKVSLVEGIEEKNHSIIEIPRSREVGQSYITSIFTTLVSIVAAITIVLEHKPDIIFCNGPGTCIPLCIASLLLQRRKCRIVYFESFARVNRLSLSGRICYYLTQPGHFVVQSKYLYKKYPKSVLLQYVV